MRRLNQELSALLQAHPGLDVTTVVSDEFKSDADRGKWSEGPIIGVTIEDLAISDIHISRLLFRNDGFDEYVGHYKAIRGHMSDAKTERALRAEAIAAYNSLYWVKKIVVWVGY